MTVSVSPSSSPTGYKAMQSTTTFTVAGASNSTSYWLVLNYGSANATMAQSGGGQAHAYLDSESVILPFKTDGSGNATVKWVPQGAGTWSYQLVLQPSYSAVGSSTGTITVTTAS